MVKLKIMVKGYSLTKKFFNTEKLLLYSDKLVPFVVEIIFIHIQNSEAVGRKLKEEF